MAHPAVGSGGRQFAVEHRLAGGQDVTVARDDRLLLKARSAQELGHYPLLPSAFAPRSPAIAKQFVLDKSDASQTLPPPPRNRFSERGRYWNLYGECP